MTTKKQDNQIRVVAQAYLNIKQEDAWTEVLNYGDLGFVIAFIQNNGMEDMSPSSLSYAYSVYQVLLESMAVDDIVNSYESWGDIVETSAKKQSEVSN